MLRKFLPLALLAGVVLGLAHGTPAASMALGRHISTMSGSMGPWEF